MSEYLPPNNIEPISIFNPANFDYADESLTVEYANKHYLKYPIAQGKEYLKEFEASGYATMKASANIQTSSSVPLLVSGVGDLTKAVQFYQVGGGFNIRNIVNSGSINISSKNSGGTMQQILGLTTDTVQISSTSLTLSTTNPPTCSASQPSSSDSSSKIPTTAWVQSAISVVNGTDLNKNSLTITPVPSLSSLTGIHNYYGIGAKYSQNWFGGGGRTITITITNVPTLTQSTSTIGGNDYYSFTVNFNFFQSAQTGNWSGTTPPTTKINKNSGTMQLFPTRLTGANAVSIPPYGEARINNYINGNTNYSMYNVNYAPYGRPFWCSDFQYSTWGSSYSSDSIDVSVYYQKINSNTVRYQITAYQYFAPGAIFYNTMTNCNAEITGAYFNNTTYPMQIYFS